ncbi:MAG: hypothetical protein AABY83_11460 [Pseudomonadota bacterium]
MDIRYTRWIASFILLPSAWAGDGIATAPWPQVTVAEPAIHVQFGPLETHLPATLLKRVTVIPFTATNLSVSSRADAGGEAFQFGLLENFEQYVDMYREKGYLKGHQAENKEQFLDVLFDKENHKSKGIKTILRLLAIKNASSYVKYTQEPFIVYRATGERGKSDQTLYIALQNDFHLYLIRGMLNEEQVKTILSGLSVVGRTQQ